MKKLFTLVAVAMMAVGANAQEEAWNVYEYDAVVTDSAILKADYVANEDPSAMSVVEFSTENVTGTHTSGPIAGYEDGDEPPLEAKVDNTWGTLQTKDLSPDGSIDPFYYVCGKGNPVNIELVKFRERDDQDGNFQDYTADWDDSYYLPDGTAGLPTNGTYVTLTPAVDGTLSVAVWVNKNDREIYIAKASDAKALSFANGEVYLSGYVNGTNWDEDYDVDMPAGFNGYVKWQDNIAMKESNEYVIGEGNQAAWVYINFFAYAGETYYIFNKSTQIGFSGFTFTAGEAGISEIVASTANPNAPVYNLAGQRVAKSAKGILIQNGKKFISK